MNWLPSVYSGLSNFLWVCVGLLLNSDSIHDGRQTKPEVVVLLVLFIIGAVWARTASKEGDKTVQEETMDLTIADLIGKMAVAKYKLEQMKVPECSMTCPSQDDTGPPVACKCGAEKKRSELREVIQILTIK